MNNNTNSSHGVGFFGLLQVAFIVLKLAEIGAVASWSWWWVLLPLWISLGIISFFLVVVLLIKALGK